MDLQIHTVSRASLKEIEQAWTMVNEYYEEVGVIAREDRVEFEQQYFTEETGLWLAIVAGEAVGCVALHKLPKQPKCGEIKRMYVHTPFRGTGIPEALLEALEHYALEHGYEWLYLDTAASMQAAAKFYARKTRIYRADAITITPKPPCSCADL